MENCGNGWLLDSVYKALDGRRGRAILIVCLSTHSIHLPTFRIPNVSIRVTYRSKTRPLRPPCMSTFSCPLSFDELTLSDTQWVCSVVLLGLTADRIHFTRSVLGTHGMFELIIPSDHSFLFSQSLLSLNFLRPPSWSSSGLQLRMFFLAHNRVSRYTDPETSQMVHALHE